MIKPPNVFGLIDEPQTISSPVLSCTGCTLYAINCTALALAVFGSVLLFKLELLPVAIPGIK